MEQNNTNSTQEFIEQSSERSELHVPARAESLIVPEREPTQEIAVKIGEEAVAIGLPDMSQYTPNEG